MELMRKTNATKLCSEHPLTETEDSSRCGRCYTLSCQWCIIFHHVQYLIVDGCSSMTNPVSLATFKLLASYELHLLLSSIFIFNINTLKIVLIGVKTCQGTFFHSLEIVSTNWFGKPYQSLEE